MSKDKAGLAVAYAAKRRQGPKAPMTPAAEPTPEQSIVAAIMAKRAPKPPVEEDLSLEDDLTLDTADLIAFEEEMPSSTSNSLADKIRARMLK